MKETLYLVVKLINGTEILGEIVEQQESGTLGIKRPLHIELKPGPNGYGPHMGPWCPFAADDDKPVYVDPPMIITTYAPRIDIVKSYHSAWETIRGAKSGLALPRSGLPAGGIMGASR